MRTLWVALLLLQSSVLLLQAQQIIPLPHVPAPDSIHWYRAEKQYISPAFQTEVVANVSKPSITAFLPPPDKANGTALIIAPGGGFHILSINNEGLDVAKWCVENGIAAFVLHYRLVPTGDDGILEFIQKLQAGQEEMDRSMAPVISLANADGLAAIQYVREHAAELGVDPGKIGIIGFSAGGTVAASAAFHYTSEKDRPDFAAPIYAALHVVDQHKMPDQPMPLFLAVTSDDNFGFQLPTADLFKLWNTAAQPVEMHIYEKGGHGFGMKKQNLPSDHWITAFSNWLSLHGWK